MSVFSHVFVKTGHQQPFKLQDIFITVTDDNVAAFSTVHLAWCEHARDDHYPTYIN